MDSAVGSPVSKLSAEVASGTAAAAEAVTAAVKGPVDAVAALPGSVGSAVSKWTSDTGGWIEEQTKIQVHTTPPPAFPAFAARPPAARPPPPPPPAA